MHMDRVMRGTVQAGYVDTATQTQNIKVTSKYSVINQNYRRISASYLKIHSHLQFYCSK